MKDCWGKDGKKRPYKGKEREENKKKKESNNTETEDDKNAQANNTTAQSSKPQKGQDITLMVEDLDNAADDEDSNMAAIDNYGTA